MTTSIEFSRPFSNQQTAGQEIKILSDLTQRSHSLEKGNGRLKNLERIYEIAQSIHSLSDQMEPDDTISLDELESRIRTALPFREFDTTLPEIFSKETTSELARRLLSDLDSITTPPIKPSRLGKNGPTFLVNYLQSMQNQLLHHSFVIKWTHPIEIVCNQVYKDFLKLCKTEETSAETLFAPEIATIDFQKETYTNTSRQTEPLIDKENLKLNLQTIVECFSRKKPNQVKKIMFSEKVPGQNIKDFISSDRYSNLTPSQKQTFFMQLGSIAMLDLIMGNFERFFSAEFATREGEMLAAGIVANLGNAMIVLPKLPTETDQIFLAAIDNGITERLCTGKDDREEWSCEQSRREYNALIQSTISSPEERAKFIENIIQAFAICKPFMNEISNAEQFFQDLDNNHLCRQNIKLGILKMCEYLSRSIVPFWHSEQSEGLKKYIESTHSRLLRPLNERIEVFRSSYASLDFVSPL